MDTNNGEAMRVLLVEDNERLATLVAKGLATNGVVVEPASTAEQALTMLAAAGFDVVVVDLGLPDRDGLELIAAMRKDGDARPILVISARGALQDRVAGLEAGADDYLVKPVAADELAARLRALRRRPARLIASAIRVGNVAFDTVDRCIEVNGARCTLARGELTILEVLLRRHDRLVSKDLLQDELYGIDGDVGSNTIEVRVHRLRRRLAELGATIAIRTVRRVGYLLTESGTPPPDP